MNIHKGRCPGGASQDISGRNLSRSFFLAEAQGCYLVFLAEGTDKAGAAAVPACPGDFLDGGAGMDQQL